MSRITLEKLAGMVQQGFESMTTRFDTLESRVSSLERGQEDILLKLDQYAYKFEVQDIKRRVDKLEKRVYK